PTKNWDSLKMYMQADLKKYFTLDAAMENRKMKCLVLTAEDTSLVSAGNNFPPAGKGYNQFSVDAHNAFYWEFTIALTFQYLIHSPYPFFDETNIRGKVNMNFDADLSDWQSLSNALKKYKMNLRLEERETPVLVIKDTEH
ncbi:MAG TPA: hypothetical protein VK787_14135, partial [Puia sp.]|nr:hypothetical protein [Puia sp.]